MLKDLSLKGVLVGAITIIATSILLSVLMPLVFMELIKSGDSDVLITSFWPQIYTLINIFIAGCFGVYIGSVVADKAVWINSVAIIGVSLFLTYIINQPLSEFSDHYPLWFHILSYGLSLTSLVVGHFLSKKFIVSNHKGK